MKSKVKYTEGNLFIIDLPNQKRFLGLITHRKGKTKLLFGYFWKTEGAEAELLIPIPEHALTAAFFSGLGFEIGTWKLTGTLQSWNKEDWPIPMLKRKDELRKCIWGITYNEEMVSVTSQKITPEQAANMPKEGVHGYIALENHLDWLTGGHPYDE